VTAAAAAIETDGTSAAVDELAARVEELAALTVTCLELGRAAAGLRVDQGSGVGATVRGRGTAVVLERAARPHEEEDEDGEEESGELRSGHGRFKGTAARPPRRFERQTGGLGRCIGPLLAL
jgi:hypothetical protein